MSITRQGRNNQNSQSMPESGGPGQACIWLISCLLFLLLLTGGVFLAMYISLPASTDHAWLLPAGMGLVAAPWIFWILTCLYRCIVLRIVYSRSTGEEGSPPPQQVARQSTAVATAAPLATVVEEEAESPGGAVRKVRFGNAIVVGANGDNCDEETGMEPQTGPSRDGGGSSSTSRESEQPLALSMSS